MIGKSIAVVNKNPKIKKRPQKIDSQPLRRLFQYREVNIIHKKKHDDDDPWDDGPSWATITSRGSIREAIIIIVVVVIGRTAVSSIIIQHRKNDSRCLLPCLCFLLFLFLTLLFAVVVAGSTR
jgi:hypothetical protein